MHTTNQRRPLQRHLATAMVLAAGIAPAFVVVQGAAAAVPDDVGVELVFDLDGPVRPGATQTEAGFTVSFYDKDTAQTIDTLDEPLTIDVEGLYAQGTTWGHRVRNVDGETSSRLVGFDTNNTLRDSVSLVGDQVTVQDSGTRVPLPFTAPDTDGYAEFTATWGEGAEDTEVLVAPVQKRHNAMITEIQMPEQMQVGQTLEILAETRNPAADPFIIGKASAYWHETRPTDDQVETGEEIFSQTWMSSGFPFANVDSWTPRPEMRFDITAPRGRGEGVIALRMDYSDSVPDYLDQQSLDAVNYMYIDVKQVAGEIIPEAPASVALNGSFTSSATMIDQTAADKAGLVGTAYYLPEQPSDGLIPAGAEEIASESFAIGEDAEMIIPALEDRTGVVATVWSAQGDIVKAETTAPLFTEVKPNVVTGRGAVSTELATIGDSITATFEPSLVGGTGAALSSLPADVNARWVLTVADAIVDEGVVAVTGTSPVSAEIKLPTDVSGAATVTWSIEAADQPVATRSLVQEWSEGNSVASFASKALRVSGTVSADRVIVTPTDKASSAITTVALDAQDESLSALPAEVIVKVTAYAVPGILLSTAAVPTDAKIVAERSFPIEQVGALEIGDIASGAAEGELSTLAFVWSVDPSNGAAEAWTSTSTVTLDARTSTEQAAQAVDSAAAETAATAETERLSATGAAGVGIGVLAALLLVLAGGVLVAVRQRELREQRQAALIRVTE